MTVRKLLDGWVEAMVSNVAITLRRWRCTAWGTRAGTDLQGMRALCSSADEKSVTDELLYGSGVRVCQCLLLVPCGPLRVMGIATQSEACCSASPSWEGG